MWLETPPHEQLLLTLGKGPQWNLCHHDPLAPDLCQAWEGSIHPHAGDKGKPAEPWRLLVRTFCPHPRPGAQKERGLQTLTSLGATGFPVPRGQAPSRWITWLPTPVAGAVCSGRRVMLGGWGCGSVGGAGCGGVALRLCAVWRGEGGTSLGTICGKAAWYTGWAGSWATAG